MRFSVQTAYSITFLRETETETQTETQTDRQTDRQKDRRTDSQTENLLGSMNRNTNRLPLTRPTSNLSRQLILLPPTELQLTTFSKFANTYISKFRILLVWCHLSHCVFSHMFPKFYRVFHLPNQTCDQTWIYFVYIWSSCIEMTGILDRYRLNFPIWLTFPLNLFI